MRIVRTDEEQRERDDQAEMCHAARVRPRARHASHWIDVARDVVENGARRYRGTLLDNYTASMLVQVYDRLGFANRAKLDQIADKNLLRAINICWAAIK